MAEWSERAKEDFKEREEYRKDNDEKDRYEKKDESEPETEKDKKETAEDAREDRRAERGYNWGTDDLEADLIQLRNSGDEEAGEKLERLRARYDWYESEYNRLDQGYREMYEEVERLRKENRRYMMRDSYAEARQAERAAKESQEEDIRRDSDIQSYEDLWRRREG